MGICDYLVSNAIVLPATGWLGRYFGRKRFLITCIGVFTLASMLCGFATSLGMLIFARIFKARAEERVPMAQAILLETFPKENVVFSPCRFMPWVSWLRLFSARHWGMDHGQLFVALGVFHQSAGGSALVTRVLLLPGGSALVAQRATGHIDTVGFGLLILWVSSLQIVLDKGQTEDWLSSPLIVTLSVVSAVTFIFF